MEIMLKFIFFICVTSLVFSRVYWLLIQFVSFQSGGCVFERLELCAASNWSFVTKKYFQRTWSCDKKHTSRASLVAQWLRICLPMQGTRVRALVWEDPTCHGATRPVSHNY